MFDIGVDLVQFLELKESFQEKLQLASNVKLAESEEIEAQISALTKQDHYLTGNLKVEEHL